MVVKNALHEIPLPPHFDPSSVGEIWKVDYSTRAAQALEWAHQFNLPPAARDTPQVALIAIDVQNTFCIPGFELFVAGRSGTGAVEDNHRLCEFIYRNLDWITHIAATLDTHTAMQIFHPIFLVDEHGQNPAPLTLISYEDILQGRWKFNAATASSLKITPEYGQQHLLHYASELKARQKYDLTIWPYHVMLGSIGHALVPAVEEAIFFHTIARFSQADFQIKGNNPLTEHYSAIGPEVLDGPAGERIAEKNRKFSQELENFDAVFIAGQAKSHCVAWTINDLLNDLLVHNERLVEKVYLLEDCTSPVVVPGVVDYTEQAEAAFRKFAQAGMHVVRSTEPIQAYLR
jgi:nicotinamidase-related amidase